MIIVIMIIKIIKLIYYTTFKYIMLSMRRMNVFINSKKDTRTMSHFCTPCKRQKTSAFQTFLGVTKMERPSGVFIVYFERIMHINCLSCNTYDCNQHDFMAPQILFDMLLFDFVNNHFKIIFY